jgi:pimeloyl-ACP methyl ester carboxylesterase
MITQIPFLDFGGEGPLLHFAHANAYPPACYRQFIRPFLPHFHTLAIKHRPLWPGSSPDEFDSWQLIADDLIRFFDQENLRGVIGVGHSLGAVATMYAAVARPELFRALVLVEPVFLTPQILQLAAAHPEKMAKQPFVLRAQNRRSRWPSRQAAFDRFRGKQVFERWSDEALWDYVNGGVHEDETGEFVLTYPREWESRIYGRPPLTVWEKLPQVTQPMLGLRAANSDTIFPEAWQLWQELQPDATFVEVPELGHMLPMERPSTVAQIILDWLEERLKNED